mmetsp:Transcript_120129/g.209121  ORF Transcript_120129/g.209121 Transcript_120129/m.209121 type:complete len:231 (-) Transcript_120129:177-869(-)
MVPTCSVSVTMGTTVTGVAWTSTTVTPTHATMRGFVPIPGPIASLALVLVDGLAPHVPLTSTIAAPIHASMGRIARTRALTATSAPVFQGGRVPTARRTSMTVPATPATSALVRTPGPTPSRVPAMPAIRVPSATRISTTVPTARARTEGPASTRSTATTAIAQNHSWLLLAQLPRKPQLPHPHPYPHPHPHPLEHLHLHQPQHRHPHKHLHLRQHLRQQPHQPQLAQPL